MYLKIPLEVFSCSKIIFIVVQAKAMLRALERELEN